MDINHRMECRQQHQVSLMIVQCLTMPPIATSINDYQKCANQTFAFQRCLIPTALCNAGGAARAYVNTPFRRPHRTPIIPSAVYQPGTVGDDSEADNTDTDTLGHDDIFVTPYPYVPRKRVCCDTVKLLDSRKCNPRFKSPLKRE